MPAGASVDMLTGYVRHAFREGYEAGRGHSRSGHRPVALAKQRIDRRRRPQLRRPRAPHADEQAGSAL